MKKLMVTVCAILVSMNIFAASNNAVVNDNSLFNGKEWGISLNTGYTMDKAVSFKQAYSVNLGVGAFWFPYRNLGFEAAIPLYTTTGITVDEVQAGMLLRFPLSKSAKVLKNIAPYLGVGGVGNWKTDMEWAYIGKVGVDFRTNSKVGFFTELQYRNNKYNAWSDGQMTILGGLKLVLF